jgi:hypothetical protein
LIRGGLVAHSVQHPETSTNTGLNA